MKININFLKVLKGQYIARVNCQLLTVVKPKGFTLVELLTYVALFAVIGIIGFSMLTFTLRGAKKTDAMENIRGSGDVILSKMVRTVRYSTSIDSPDCSTSATAQALTVKPINGNTTTFSCTAIPNAIAVNGVSLLDTSTITVQNCSFVCRKDIGTETPTVTIQFTLSSKDTSGFFENKVTIPFQTNVTLRNATP